MHVDLTITISAILGATAVISPILTAIINNHYAMKLKRIELQHQMYENTSIHNRAFYENYLRNAGRCVLGCDAEAFKDYGESYFLALMLSSDPLREEMIKANALIAQNDYENATKVIENITPVLRANTQLP